MFAQNLQETFFLFQWFQMLKEVFILHLFYFMLDVQTAFDSELLQLALHVHTV